MNDTPPLPESYGKDRKVGLIIGGVIAVLLGIVCALFVPLLIFGQVSTSKPGDLSANIRSILPAVGFYGLQAILLICLGIGSIMARRWARALLLILSWIWLLGGIMGTASMLLFLPIILETVGETTKAGDASLSPVATWIILLIPIVTFAFFLIIIPIAGILFYGSKSVKATCEARDQIVRWTDRCPLPVLTVSLWLIFCMTGMALMPFIYHTIVIPFFGIWITGIPATLIYMGMAALAIYAAIAIYRLRWMGWWIVILSVALFGASNFITYFQRNPSELYQLMDYSAQQVQQMEKFLNGKTMAWLTLAGTLLSLGYLFYIRRFFPKRIPIS